MYLLAILTDERMGLDGMPNDPNDGEDAVMILFQCPQCNLRYSVADHLVGKTAKCKCGAKFKVPSSAGGLFPCMPTVSEAPAHDVFIS